jgi:hypothetical protein
MSSGKSMQPIFIAMVSFLATTLCLTAETTRIKQRTYDCYQTGFP